jgi:hypothetical protein
MAVIQNKWIEKQKKKKTNETAPAYDSDPLADSSAYNAKKPEKRHTNASRSTMVRTLRGMRK